MIGDGVSDEDLRSLADAAKGAIGKEDIDFLVGDRQLALLVSKIIKSLIVARKIAPMGDGECRLTDRDIGRLLSDDALFMSAMAAAKSLIVAKRAGLAKT